jgi:hypothetical protein
LTLPLGGRFTNRLEYDSLAFRDESQGVHPNGQADRDHPL